MRKFLLFFLSFILCVVPVFADDTVSDDGGTVPDTVTTTENSTPVVVDITSLINNDKTSDDEEVKEVIAMEPELVGVTSTLQRVSASDATGFKAVLLSLLGDYETVVTDYEYRTGTSGYTSHSISIERDWAWLCSCGIFAILLYCTFRTIGGICARF